jgi:hypothetical protein
MPSKPITPAEVTAKKQELLPDEVIDSFNELIAKNWDGHSATIKQDKVADLIATKLNMPKDKVFANHWLDVEDIYRKAGWKVYYDKPGYNESYEATFKFSRKEKGQ